MGAKPSKTRQKDAGVESVDYTIDDDEDESDHKEGTNKSSKAKPQGAKKAIDLAEDVSFDDMLRGPRIVLAKLKALP